jgi:hypothetical protein
MIGLFTGIARGEPFIIGGPLYGAIVGATMFVGLLISALISGRRK